LLSVSVAYSISAQELYKKWEKLLPWEDDLNSAAFSPDDRYFIAGGPSKIYKLNTEDASVVWSIPSDCKKVAYSKDGNKFYTSSYYDRVFRVFDAQTGALLGSYLQDLLSKDTLLSHIQEFVISPDGLKSYIFVRYKWDPNNYGHPYKSDRYIVFDLINNTILHDVQLKYLVVNKLIISPDGKWLGMVTDDGIDRKNLRTAYVDSLIYDKGQYWWNEDKEEYITDVTFSSDSKYFVFCGYGGVARYVNIETMKKEGYLEPGHDTFLNALTFNKTNQLFLGGAADFSALTIWDFNKNKQMIGYYPDIGVYPSQSMLCSANNYNLLVFTKSFFILYSIDSSVSSSEILEINKFNYNIIDDTLYIEHHNLNDNQIYIIISIPICNKT
jgi:WD40 repeat protein